MPVFTSQLNPAERPPRLRRFVFPRSYRPISLNEMEDTLPSDSMINDTVECPEGYSMADAYERYIAENPIIDTQESLYRIEHLRELRDREDRDLTQYIRNLVRRYGQTLNSMANTATEAMINTETQIGVMVDLIRRARLESYEGESYLSMLGRYSRHSTMPSGSYNVCQTLMRYLSELENTSQALDHRMVEAVERRSPMGNVTLSSFTSGLEYFEEPRQSVADVFRNGTNAILSSFSKKPKKKRAQNHYLFGLEFEAFKPENTKLKFNHTGFGTDGSIAPPNGFRGMEFRVEPMTFEASHKYIPKLLSYVKSNGCDVNASCGFHTHLSHDIFFDKKFIKKLVFFWISIEDVIMSTQPNSRSNNYYCKRTLFQFINDFGKNIPDAKDRLISAMSNTDRYSALNLCALAAHGTIEIRLHAGTLDEDKILNWTILLKHIFDYVKDEYKPQTVHSIFRQDISDEKIQRVFKLLKLPEETAKFYTERIQKFGWERLKEQNIMAKECIIMQKARIKVSKQLIKIERSFQNKVKKIRGEIRQYRNENQSHSSRPNEDYDRTSLRAWSDATDVARSVVRDREREVEEERRGAGIGDTISIPRNPYTTHDFGGGGMSTQVYGGGGGAGGSAGVPTLNPVTSTQTPDGTSHVITSTDGERMQLTYRPNGQWEVNHPGDEGSWAYHTNGANFSSASFDEIRSIEASPNAYFNQAINTTSTGGTLTEESLNRAVSRAYELTGSPVRIPITTHEDGSWEETQPADHRALLTGIGA